MPSAVGYQPTLANDVGALQERITSTKKALLRPYKLYMYQPMTLTDLAPAATFAHLDATTVLSRSICGTWYLSRVDPLILQAVFWTHMYLVKNTTQ